MTTEQNNYLQSIADGMNSQSDRLTSDAERSVISSLQQLSQASGRSRSTGLRATEMRKNSIDALRGEASGLIDVVTQLSGAIGRGEALNTTQNLDTVRTLNNVYEYMIPAFRSREGRYEGSQPTNQEFGFSKVESAMGEGHFRELKSSIGQALNAIWSNNPGLQEQVQGRYVTFEQQQTSSVVPKGGEASVAQVNAVVKQPGVNK